MRVVLEPVSGTAEENLDRKNRMSYLLTTYHWPLLSRPRVAGFGCPVTVIVSDRAIPVIFNYLVHFGNVSKRPVGKSDNISMVEMSISNKIYRFTLDYRRLFFGWRIFQLSKLFNSFSPPISAQRFPPR